jgi:hypothetical protein
MKDARSADAALAGAAELRRGQVAPVRLEPEVETDK